MTICVGSGECLWCPGLPKRLKTMHSHWFSRKHGVVLFRGPGFADRQVHYILQLDKSDGTGFVKEVGNRLTAEDHAPIARATVTCKLFQVNDQLASLHFKEDRKVWSSEVCEYVFRVWQLETICTGYCSVLQKEPARPRQAPGYRFTL
jgi:hypothetical protein